MYEEQWLFHGPKLRAVVGVGPISERGIEGTLRVPSRSILVRGGETALPKSEPVVLDAYTHLLGCWGLDRLPMGDVIFPLRLESLEIFGDDPAEGTDVACQISVSRLERHRVRVQAEIIRPDGRVWMRLNDWDDWRFYWPPRYRDVFRRPDRELLGEALPLAGETGAVAVWVEPPGDMGRPVWRDVLECVQLSPQERQGCLKPTGDERLRSLRLWGRIAAKEAARRIWLAAGEPPVFPVDITIEPDVTGRPVLHSRRNPERDDMPAVSIAYTDGVAVGIAAPDSKAHLGIDIVSLEQGSDARQSALISAQDRFLLEQLDGTVHDEWRGRIHAAKQAVAKALCAGPAVAPEFARAVELNPCTGEVRVAVAQDFTHTETRPSPTHWRVFTHRRGDYVWAWTIAKERVS